MYDYNNKSNEKQRLKSKKQIQRGAGFCSSRLQESPLLVLKPETYRRAKGNQDSTCEERDFTCEDCIRMLAYSWEERRERG